MSVRENAVVEKLTLASKPVDLQQLGEEFSEGGYSLFHELLEGLKLKLASSDESELNELKELIRKGRAAVPNPGTISPSWESVWDEQEQMIRFKEEALRAVPAESREGEWQIVMDNPFTNEGISCYPALSFVEAAYLYAYFKKDLKKNEYLRLQKIVNLITIEGA